MSRMRPEFVTLDWDAVGNAGPVQAVLAAAWPGLQAWVEKGRAVRLRTTAASADGFPMGLGGHPLQVEQRPALPPATQAEGAVVEPGAVVGGGSRVWRFTHIRSGAIVGEGCNLGQGVYMDAGAVIGCDCKVQNGVNVYRGVVLGDGVFVGPAATFTNDRHPRAQGDWAVTPTLIGMGASIGANATVVCGSHVGAHALVGAGAVVTRPVPAHALVAGVPARIIGYVCACGRRVQPTAGDRWVCAHCGAEGPAGDVTQSAGGSG